MDPSPSLPIDRSQLQECSEGDRVFEQELLTLFVEDTQQHLGRLQVAIATQDVQTAQREAHHIKGSSAHIGAQVMFTLATAIEDHMKQQTTLPDPLLSQLATAYQEVVALTEQWYPESTRLS